MIRGKAVEEAIRLACAMGIRAFSVTRAQEIASNQYNAETETYPKHAVKSYARPINALVRGGIRAFHFLKVGKLIDGKHYKKSVQNREISVFPDFVFDKLSLDGKEYKNCCVELKVTSKFNKSTQQKHADQCANYAPDETVRILLYLIHNKRVTRRTGSFAVQIRYFLVSSRKKLKKN